ncbi:arylsulfatase [Flavilitoribacter nigricans]|uniref:Arylsulfatase n=1 Tax=Flavilitoribacter nigricans (strain ATCC 23147 / DSM 23189 / NBRC 102662 / NCIMB 1420 / SS-2) TaxID=1122177 RepID=A0A2D0NCH2_FLAN2|nr:arylsulfatase [Flavilitoribacter nigricans]PHN05879.1 arylsulfatase [Flavilitoribacter nigricans DSM 23189 = NBRC 102662]
MSKWLWCSLIGLLFACDTGNVDKSADGTSATADDRPNIIVIMADDLGFSDLGCYGGEINTPNLDRLAGNGLRFTSFYNTARCCPSRAAMLTGLYPHQAGIGRMTMDAGQPGYQGTLDQQAVTIAELLKAAGYQTGMTGKWHVSPTERLAPEKQLPWLAHQADMGPFSDTATYPAARGFEKYYGNIWGVVDYFDPFSLVNGMETVASVPDDYYHTDAIGDTAVAYVEEFSRSEEPFFLYVAHCAPHWPLQAPEEEIEKYKDTYRDGWRAIRNARYENMKKLGLFGSESPELSPFMFPELEWANSPDTIWDARAMAVHAAMVDRMDQSIGRLLDKLEATGELDNTLILFFSDNGASSERPSRYGPGFDRAGSTRAGAEVFFPVEKETEHLPGPQTVHSGIGPVWANVINAPFRFWKAKVYEGGITSPFIAHWPRRIANGGAVKSQTAHIIDLMPTFLEMAGTSYPETFAGKTLTPAPGKSMLGLLAGDSEAEIHEQLFWEHFGSAALREGNMKLIRLDRKADWELYDLSKDRTELHDLAKEQPDKTRAMAEKWEQLAQEFRVYPLPN